MSKQQLKQSQTEVLSEEGNGSHNELTYTFDDNVLPSPQELEEYKKVDPKIVDYLLSAAKSEQEYRHKTGYDKIKIVKSSERRNFRINWWGMFFAFLCIVCLCGVVAYSLYLGEKWIAYIIGGGTMLSIASIFIKRPTDTNRQAPDNKKK